MEDFKGKDLKEKVAVIDVLEINCVLFIPSDEKKALQLYIQWLYIERDSERYCVKLYNGKVTTDVISHPKMHYYHLTMINIMMILLAWNWNFSTLYKLY